MADLMHFNPDPALGQAACGLLLDSQTAWTDFIHMTTCPACLLGIAERARVQREHLVALPKKKRRGKKRRSGEYEESDGAVSTEVVPLARNELVGSLRKTTRKRLKWLSETLDVSEIDVLAMAVFELFDRLYDPGDEGDDG